MQNRRNEVRRWFAVFFFTGLLCTGTHPAQAEICIPEITSSDGFTPELTAAAASDCVTLWSGTLAVTGTPATILVESDIRLPDEFTSRLKAGLIEADQALIKIKGSGSAPSLGPKITMVVTRQNDGVSTASAEGTFGGRNPCYFSIMPDAYESETGKAQIKISIAHELFHCLQYAEVPVRLQQAGIQPDKTDLNLWWAEASAEWFGILAQPDYERTELGITTNCAPILIHTMSLVSMSGRFLPGIRRSMVRRPFYRLLTSCPAGCTSPRLLWISWNMKSGQTMQSNIRLSPSG